MIPSDAQNIPVRPLDKGVIRNLSTLEMPKGSLWTCENFFADQTGPRRRPGWNNSMSATGYDFPIRDMISFRLVDNTPKACVIDTKLLYTLSSGTPTLVEDSYSTGTIACAAGSTSVTGTDTIWSTNDIRAGDVMILDPVGNAEKIVINAVNGDTAITLDSAPVNTYSGDDYTILRSWGANFPYAVDWQVLDNLVVFTDGARAPRSFDGATLDGYDAGVTYIAQCLTVYRRRLLLGNLNESGAYYRHRIRYSTPTDRTDFTSAGAGWLHVRESGGPLLRLIPMGPLVVAYFQDAIYIGRSSGDYSLPIIFDPIDTGGIGLAGMKAVHPWPGGHFLIMQDDIAFLTTNGIERIGTPIVKSTVRNTEYLESSYVCPDPINHRIVFGFPGGSSGELSTLWSFDYHSKAWSSETKESCSMIAYRGIESQVTWDTLLDAPYSTGLVSGSLGAKIVHGDSVDFSANATAGDYFKAVSVDADGTIGTVDSATQITLTASLAVNLTDAAYRIVSQSQDWDTGMLTYPSWDAIEGEGSAGRFYYGTSAGTIKVLSEDDKDDLDTTSILGIIETGDFDFGTPNTESVFKRFSLKIDAELADDLSFYVEVSRNRGRSWKYVGTMNILAGADEGAVSFRQKGSTHRIRLTTSSVTAPFSVSEFVLKVIPASEEVHLR